MSGSWKAPTSVRCGIPLATVGLALLLGAFTASLASVEDAWSTDGRLSQMVAVRAEGLPIGELLPLLSEKTGVRLIADTGCRR